MYTIRDNTGRFRLAQSLEEVAKIVQLDPHEIAWALEEYGRCETDKHWVVVDSESHADASQLAVTA